MANRILSDAIGTLRSFWRIGTTRLKDNAGVLEVRNSADSANIKLRVGDLAITAGSPKASMVWTAGDTAGEGSWEVPPGRNRHTRWHDETTVITGNAFLVAPDANQRYGWFAYQNPPALNDVFVTAVDLAPGATYRLSVLGSTGGQRGIVSWYANNVFIGNQDWYAAAVGYNVVKTFDFTVSGAISSQQIEGRIDSKNPSSSGYIMPLTKFWFTYLSG